MTLSIDYNFPTDQRSATVSLGSGTIQDSNFMFRIGVLEKSDATKIHWVLPEWMTWEEAQKAKVRVTRDNIILLDKKETLNNSIVGRVKMDIGVEWPDEAVGASVTNVLYIV